MTSRRRKRTIRIVAVGAIFATGFLCGSLTQRSADAQLGDVMKKAAESGALGPAGELGTAIVDMQDHVTALQKNIDTLKKVKSSLGG